MDAVPVDAATPDSVGRARRRGRPRNADGLDTRVTILDAAIAEFAQHGLAATTRAICEGAGVGSSTVYHHFGSKRALYADAYRHAIRVAFDRYECAVAGVDTLREELHALLEAALSILRERPEITALAIRAQADLSLEELASAHLRAADHFVPGMAKRGIERGELSSDDARLFEHVVAGLLWGLSFVGRNESAQRSFVSGFERLIDGTLFQNGARGAP